MSASQRGDQRSLGRIATQSNGQRSAEQQMHEYEQQMEVCKQHMQVCIQRMLEGSVQQMLEGAERMREIGQRMGEIAARMHECRQRMPQHEANHNNFVAYGNRNYGQQAGLERVHRELGVFRNYAAGIKHFEAFLFVRCSELLDSLSKPVATKVPTQAPCISCGAKDDCPNP